MRIRIRIGTLSSLFFIFWSLLSENLIAQRRVFVIDSLTIKPIPYAFVKYSGETIETNENGLFLVNKPSEEIIIWSEGYLAKTVVSSLVNDTIMLNPNVYSLEEVVVSRNQRSKIFRIGYLEGKDIHFRLKNQYEIGCYIPNPNKNFTFFIIEVGAKLSNANKKGSVKVNIYDLEEERPNALIFSSNDLSEKEIDKIPISRLSFPESGVFVSILYKSEEEDDGPFILLTDKYYKSKSSIRGSHYGTKWVKMEKLNFRNIFELNTRIHLKVESSN